MNKYVRYGLLIALLGMAMTAILLLWQHQKKIRRFDGTITLSSRDKRPYGSYVAFQELSAMFKGVPFVRSQRSQGFLNDLSDSDRHQLMFILSPQFYVNESEWQSLIRWVRQGNYLVVSANRFSQTAKDELHIELNSFKDELPPLMNQSTGDDSLRIGLSQPPFGDTDTYFYPGRKFDRAVVSLDSSFTGVLGTNDIHYANLIHIRAGEGTLLVQLAPLAFSNYFLLYGHNIRYFENVFSAVPAPVSKVIWNEYYLYKQEEKTPLFNALNKLLHDPALGPAFLILLLMVAVYVLLEHRRRQRVIPMIEPQANESLDFVKTIGRLYYEKGDHRNLAIKFGQHFLEYVRTRYQGNLDLMDGNSIRQLHYRSGVNEEVVRGIATYIRFAQDSPELAEEQLEEYYRLLDTFYKTAK